MKKISCLIFLILFNAGVVISQNSTYATASTSAEIIVPVGAGITGDLNFDNFLPGKNTGRIEIKNNKLLLKNNLAVLESVKNVSNPSFQILSAESSYTVTINYDPVLINNNQMNAPIFIEEFSILPLPGSPELNKNEEGFSIGAVLRLSPSQAPGRYSAPAGYTVVVHFN